jgi:hypothetical protein
MVRRLKEELLGILHLTSNSSFFVLDDHFQTVRGKTISTDDFYEGQVRNFSKRFAPRRGIYLLKTVTHQ